MTKVLQSHFDKRGMSELPRAVFDGQIIVIQSEQEAKKAVKYLLSQPLLGLDTETRPSFRKGQLNEVALLQVSTRETCFLFRLNLIGIPACIVHLLSDERVLRVGLSWHDDQTSLCRRRKFDMKVLDLQSYVKELGIQDMSLQKLYANIFGQYISKRQQLSNWERDVLSDAQKVYAATDAWACLKLYEEMHKLRESGDYRLVSDEES